ncbi:uncharacterized protein LACBIDRAFT_314740 [Laccaria bicolor S238N-H82]|uniref:Predicted protein n=1 Tax=Laccaria bicolor (strain S238N-H82 / ATCC MYA-4686) TaxID=486041 RepID=B0DZ49_LACBS|nr:uncharacterized protein LACBIDRAFT_314740 [Laccaria bicolor S238N-H82]EDR00173.1 predicted protein [Laccaria bicolor S238N-H82]|eukprot:XP_001889230.1 predicted protein [Laccaria bicolor S238N-H82]
MVRVTLPFLKHHYQKLVHSPVPTPAAIGCPELRDDAVFWFAQLRSQHSAALPTARRNDNNPTQGIPVVHRCLVVLPGFDTSIGRTWDLRSYSFHRPDNRVMHNRLDPRGEARAAGNQDHPCDPLAAVDPCPPTGYELRPDLVRISEDDSRERDDKECEERRGWKRGGRAGMSLDRDR